MVPMQSIPDPPYFPYRSLSEYARYYRNPDGVLLARTIFFCKETDASKVACPFDPEHPIGNSVRLEIIHLITEQSDGRTKGHLTRGNAHKRYDIACLETVPPPERPHFHPPHLTAVLSAVTCPVCLTAQPDFKPLPIFDVNGNPYSMLLPVEEPPEPTNVPNEPAPETAVE